MRKARSAIGGSGLSLFSAEDAAVFVEVAVGGWAIDSRVDPYSRDEPFFLIEADMD